MMEAIMLLDNLIDESDPDVSNDTCLAAFLPNSSVCRLKRSNSIEASYRNVPNTQLSIFIACYHF